VWKVVGGGGPLFLAKCLQTGGKNSNAVEGAIPRHCGGGRVPRPTTCRPGKAPKTLRVVTDRRH